MSNLRRPFLYAFIALRTRNGVTLNLPQFGVKSKMNCSHLCHLGKYQYKQKPNPHISLYEVLNFHHLPKMAISANPPNGNKLKLNERLTMQCRGRLLIARAEIASIKKIYCFQGHICHIHASPSPPRSQYTKNPHGPQSI